MLRILYQVTFTNDENMGLEYIIYVVDLHTCLCSSCNLLCMQVLRSPILSALLHYCITTH